MTLGAAADAAKTRRGASYQKTPMHPLSESARFVLAQMDAETRYDVQDLRAFVPETGIERLREIMHELWLHRQVERVGDLGWRRRQSAAPHRAHPVASDPVRVTPEELFDHDGFAEFFK